MTPSPPPTRAPPDPDSGPRGFLISQALGGARTLPSLFGFMALRGEGGRPVYWQMGRKKRGAGGAPVPTPGRGGSPGVSPGGWSRGRRRRRPQPRGARPGCKERKIQRKVAGGRGSAGGCAGVPRPLSARLSPGRVGAGRRAAAVPESRGSAGEGAGSRAETPGGPGAGRGGPAGASRRFPDASPGPGRLRTRGWAGGPAGRGQVRVRPGSHPADTPRLGLRGRARCCAAPLRGRRRGPEREGEPRGGEGARGRGKRDFYSRIPRDPL